MPLVINTNVSSSNAQRHLAINTQMLAKSYERLASGYRINRSGDDAAGLQLSESLRSQIRGSKKAYDNVQDGINVLNIADGSFEVIQDNLQRIRELVVQAANDTYSTAQRSAMNTEIDQMRADIDRIANASLFNSVRLLDGSLTTFLIQLGPNNSATVDALSIMGALGDTRATQATGLSLTTAAVGTITSNSLAQAYLTVVDNAMSILSFRRANLGAMVNRLEGAAKNLLNSIENLSASESRIRNVDVAAESAELTRNQILQQSSATILTQANQTPNLALSLLKG